MSETLLAILGFGVMLLLIAARLHVGLAMLLTGAAGYVWLSSWHAFLGYMKTNSYHQFANYTLSVIPLFILMGALAEHSGLSAKLFRAASCLVGRFRGGLAYAVIGSCAGFGAICGSSVATTATFGRAALPELERARYDGGFATGVIAVGGTLGILIPPSVILVVYAIATEQNIAKLFMAALVPGVLAALFYCVVIFIAVRRRPDLAPAPAHAKSGETLLAMAAAWPVLVIAFVVVGGIYGGVFTPTEGGRGKRPVLNVSYDDAVNFCKWMNKKVMAKSDCRMKQNGNMLLSVAGKVKDTHSAEVTIREDVSWSEIRETKPSLLEKRNPMN